jgi:hypothetical protein
VLLVAGQRNARVGCSIWFWAATCREKCRLMLSHFEYAASLILSALTLWISTISDCAMPLLKCDVFFMHFTKTKLSLGSTVRFCSANVDCYRRVACYSRDIGLSRKFISRLRCVLLRFNFTPVLTRNICVLSYDRSPNIFFSAASPISDMHDHYYPTACNSAVENQVDSFTTLDPVMRLWKISYILTSCSILM